MNPLVEQTINLYKEMPLARKILMGVVVLAMFGGFAAMFIWANKTEYKSAYSGLNQEDAAAIVDRLKTAKTPYRIEAGGATIMVPADQVYDVRLSMAKDGIPKGSGVGFEIFDKTDFGTTEFVQKINRRRAIQGELARTIRAFDEVKDARVMIVFPKDSVFVEETKKPSASILLELKSDLSEDKVAAVAHLVASAIEDLTPKLVTIVDTTGRILFEGKSEEEKAKIDARNLADSQYKYKMRYETTLAERIQTMLERIVGKDKAIVRVTAEMDFSTSNTNEEIYDPFERETTFVRSKQILAETGQTRQDSAGIPSSVNPVVPPGGTADASAMEMTDKKNDTINYELSRRTRQTIKPMAVVQRVSVAAVVDGKYEFKTDDSGNRSKTYVPRSQVEMQQFSDIVVKAMGFNETRQDQVSMECFPFASIDELGVVEPELTGWRAVQKAYGRTIANILLVILLFLFVIRPIIKTFQGIQSTVEKETLPGGGIDIIEDGTEPQPLAFVDMDADEQRTFLDEMDKEARDAYIDKMNSEERAAYMNNIKIPEKAAYYARKDVIKATNIIKVWLSEVEEES
ncbi:FliF [Desulforapulum autotrophicum HRM2]|uniref:Flagellar M-ring protein n=1 Tax=Desulforapulum autotrophicum (strain ATCC 43914 / DSM 3382 / VKM B-1955 / HRM2) TaxID=177437 RepID=C0QAK4_DESAH|nr:flagellar basal-body MS-ring/collar protein FliF [Desulforapulum autotrophicum]ACN16787.1 FliF [Desulforapulum autotrophicum HRM2]